MNTNRHFNRREALVAVAGAAASISLARGKTVQAAESPRNGLGIVIYALGLRRRLLKAADPQHDLFEPQVFLDYCRELGAGGIQIPLGVLEPEICDRLRANADAYGMFVEGIASPPFDDRQIERFEAEIKTAARVGARAVRTVIMPGRRYEQFTSREDFDRNVERGRQALRRAKPIVQRHQVRLAVENHKDQRLEPRIALLKEIDSPFIGACVDVGNSFALLEDPLAVVEGLSPYAFSVHIKDQAVRESEDGFLLADVALGDGFLDLEQMVGVLRRAQPEVRFNLESITRDPLRVPCLAESYWPTFPDVPGSDLARTLRTVRMRTADELPSISSLPLAEQAEVEHANVIRSLAYARTHLELGRR